MSLLTAPVAPPLVGNRNFHLLWVGEGISVLGSMTTPLVFPVLAVTVFDAGRASWVCSWRPPGCPGCCSRCRWGSGSTAVIRGAS